MPILRTYAQARTAPGGWRRTGETVDGGDVIVLILAVSTASGSELSPVGDCSSD
jgi:hypothetical protein